MTLYFLPALLALLIKVGVLFAANAERKAQRMHAASFNKTESGKSQSSPRIGVQPTKPNQSSHEVGLLSLFTTMVLIMAGHNISELLGYIQFADGFVTDKILRWYYLMTVGSLALITLYSKEVSRLHAEGEIASKLITLAILISAVAIGAAFMFSDILVLGAHSIGYSATADHGAFYWLFQVYALLSFGVIVAYLIAGYLGSSQHQVQIQCGYTLLALAPIVITSLILLGLMRLGFDVNAALVMPLASAMFLVITLKGERLHGMFDIRRHIPMSLERKTSAEIMEIFSQYSQDRVNYRDALNEIEKLLVTHKHQKHGGNVSSTAASMELPRSSLYSIFRRLEIDLKDEK